MNYPTLTTGASIGASLAGAFFAFEYSQHFAEAAPASVNTKLVARAGHETTFTGFLKDANDEDAAMDVPAVCKYAIDLDHQLGELPIEVAEGQEGYEDADEFFTANKVSCEVFRSMVTLKYGGTGEMYEVQGPNELDLPDLLCYGNMDIFCEEVDKNRVYVCQSVSDFCEYIPEDGEEGGNDDDDDEEGEDDEEDEDEKSTGGDQYERED